MTTTFNIYCDESGHLPNDHQPVMVLGAVWCPLDRVSEITKRFRAIKKKHGLSQQMEVKWTKVSPAKVGFYLELVDFFFDCADLRFRALVVPDKSKLDHAAFGQGHDTWYYKMYYDMLKAILRRDDRFRIYLNIKDTRSADKIHKLHEVLCNAICDFDQNTIERVQTVRSHEVELLQLADLLIGAVQYANHRSSTGSSAKSRLVQQVHRRSGHRLIRSTPLAERKFNLFLWHSQEAR